MIRVAADGKRGERYIAAGECVPPYDFAQLIGRLRGVKPPSIKMPYPAAWMYGAVSELVAKVTGKPPLATRVMMATLNEGTRISAEKSKRELGVSFRPIEDSIRDEIAWFRANGYV